jgi:hypothetical protein
VKLPNLGEVSNASRQVATDSAMNPILWKTSIVSTVGMVCAVFAQEPLNYLLFALAAIPILVGCWAYYHFAKTDPKRLQSERHIEHMEMIGRIGDNTSGAVIEFDPNASKSSNTGGDEK